MGVAPGMRLAELQAEIRHGMGANGTQLAGGVDEVVATTLRFWPERAMAAFAAKGKGRDPKVLDAISVIWAKVREDLEARWGMDANTTTALDLLVQPIVVDISKIWFASVENRIVIRACIVEANRRTS